MAGRRYYIEVADTDKERFAQKYPDVDELIGRAPSARRLSSLSLSSSLAALVQPDRGCPALGHLVTFRPALDEFGNMTMAKDVRADVRLGGAYFKMYGDAGGQLPTVLEAPAHVSVPFGRELTNSYVAKPEACLHGTPKQHGFSAFGCSCLMQKADHAEHEFVHVSGCMSRRMATHMATYMSKHMSKHMSQHMSIHISKRIYV